MPSLVGWERPPVGKLIGGFIIGTEGMQVRPLLLPHFGGSPMGADGIEGVGGGYKQVGRIHMSP